MSYETRQLEEGQFVAQLVIHEHRETDSLDALIVSGLADLATSAGSAIQLWIREVEEGDDAVAGVHGFEPYRDLWQLRCPLPAASSHLETRAFAATDLTEFVRVNNRAFSWHPEQGHLTTQEVERQMAEPWFSSDGFRLHHVDGRLAGFCWTKAHPDHDPPLGEIFVIAIDPDFHGRGLGAPMTLAGLEWLFGKGLHRGMLYVESDNHRANRVYERLGFVHHHTNRAYRIETRP